MSSDLSTGSASRASIAAPRDVVAPFGVRERLAGLGQVLGLLQCREHDDLDGQTRVRDWLDHHPVGATGLIICLAECACEAITDTRGGSNALDYVHSMTRSRLTHSRDRTLDGEVYLTLSPTEAEAPGPADPDTTVDVQIQLITTRGHQRPIKQWTGLGHDWPQVIAPTTTATMNTLQD